MGLTLTLEQGTDNGYIPALKIWSYLLAIDYWAVHGHTTHMTNSARKFVAVLMLLWLPVFTGSALAASISMQLPQAGCHEAATVQTMSHEGMDMGEHHMHHGEMPTPADEHSPSCSSCGVCHLACTGYLAVPDVAMAAAQTAALETTPYLVVLHSFTSAPLVPPPLVRA
jgi:hypothetical protein